MVRWLGFCFPIRIFVLVSVMILLAGVSVFANDGREAAKQELFQPVSNHSSNFLYLAPNEEMPQHMQEIFEQAPSGAYVTVGTERGFLAAANAPNISELVLADANPNARLFNQINNQLLKAAKSREHYLYLRLHATKQEWLDVMKLDTESMKTIFDFWYKVVRSGHILSDGNFKEFHTPTKQGKNKRRKFGNLNYLYNDNAFSRIKKLADQNKITTIVLDFNDEKAVSSLVASLEKRGVELSVLDLSNAWWKRYTNATKTASLLRQFQKIAKPNSLLAISTQGVNPILNLARIIRDGGAEAWIYRGYTFEFIRSHSSMERFLSWLPYYIRSPKTSLGHSIIHTPRPTSKAKNCAEVFAQLPK